MFNLILGLVLFLGIHSISIFAPAYRDKLVAKNEKGYKVVYAILSFLGIYFIGIGYGALRADPSIIYAGVQSLRPLVSALMLIGFILFFAPYFPGKIKAITKNPQLLSVAIWSVSHLMVNGSLADILLFGSFLVWAIADLVSMKKRQQRTVTPLAPSMKNDIIAIVLGVIATAVFVIFLHGSLIGAPLAG